MLLPAEVAKTISASPKRRTQFSSTLSENIIGDVAKDFATINADKKLKLRCGIRFLFRRLCPETDGVVAVVVEPPVPRRPDAL